MIYLKEFETESAYNTAKDGLLTPNVSLITDGGKIMYLKGTTPTNPIVTCKFHIDEPTDPRWPTPIIQSDAFLNEIEVMKLGGEVITKKKDFVFETAGDYIFELTLKSEGIISDNAFYSSDSNNYLTDVNIGYGVTEIGSQAFYAALIYTGNTITIPSSVITIKEQAFYEVNANFIIPNSVTSIGYEAFGGAKGVTINSDVPPTIDYYSFGEYSTYKIYVPSEAVNTYKNYSDEWAYIQNRIEPIP